MEHLVKTIEQVEARMRGDQQLVNRLCELGGQPLRYPTAARDTVHTFVVAPGAAPEGLPETRRRALVARLKAAPKKITRGGGRPKKALTTAAPDPEPAPPARTSPAEAPDGESLPEAQRRVVATIAEPFTVDDILALMPAGLQDDAARKKVSANCSYWRVKGYLAWASESLGPQPASYKRTKDWDLS